MSRGDHIPFGVENRRHSRYTVALPLEVRIRTKDPATHAATRDIAAAGLCFTVSEPCEVGAPLEFDMILPQETTRGQTVRIRCRGRVVRVERKATGRILVAATIDRHEFVRTP